MEWLFGIYLFIGVAGALRRFADANPARKPVWMSLERNPIKVAAYFTVYAITWPVYAFLKR